MMLVFDDTLPARTRQLLGLPPSTKPNLPTLTVRQLLDQYRERHLRKSKESREAYHVGAVARTELPIPTGGTSALGDWLVVDVTADTLERLREVRTVQAMRPQPERKAANKSGGAVAANRDLRLLRAAWNWAVRVGYVERSPFKRGTEAAVRLAAEPARSRRLYDGEGDRLLAKCGKRLRPIVEAALETGCRKGELLTMQWSQVSFEPRPEIWLPAGKTKTGKARRVPMSARLKAVLDMRRNDPKGEPLPADAFVFGDELGGKPGAIKTAWGLALKRAKITDLHFHDLRREAGSRWMDAGVPLATIQRWLGHSNIAQTSVYLSGTHAGEHEAMRRFDERRSARLIPIDTGGAQPMHQTTSATIEGHGATAESTTRH